jgi:hypothetical protein
MVDLPAPVGDDDLGKEGISDVKAHNQDGHEEHQRAFAVGDERLDPCGSGLQGAANSVHYDTPTCLFGPVDVQ